jgi:aminomethyltransferase
MLQRTPLYEFHVACGAKMVEYAGWEMPILYRGISEEHIQTRQSGSLFDVSHMGRLHITGKEAIPLLNYVLTRNVEIQKIGQSRYSLVCNAAGGVLDDVIVSKDVKHWLIVCNAANRAKIVKHLNDVRDVRGFAADIADNTESTAMVAMQGPKALDYVGDILGMDLRSIPRYGFEIDTYMMTRVAAFRSGYTGEDGMELIVSARMASGAVKSLS